MIAKAHYKVDMGVEERREAIGISPVVSKVLAGLYQAPPMTAEDISRRMYLGHREVEDALAECVSRGEIELLPSGLYTLTELGSERRGRARRVCSNGARLPVEGNGRPARYRHPEQRCLCRARLAAGGRSADNGLQPRSGCPLCAP